MVKFFKANLPAYRSGITGLTDIAPDEAVDLVRHINGNINITERRQEEEEEDEENDDGFEWPTVPSRPSTLLRSQRLIVSQKDLEVSAQAWTTAKAQVVTKDGEFVAQYRHDMDLSHDQDPSIIDMCIPDSIADDEGDCTVLCINAQVLARFSPWLVGYIVNKHGLEAVDNGYIILPTMTERVLTATIEYLQGEPLHIKLPTPPLSYAQKTRLLDFSHLAHLFAIDELMSAAMHALCTAYHRVPMDWVYDERMKALLEETTFEGNPARRYIESTSKNPAIIASVDKNGLPSNPDIIDDICNIDYVQWKKIWCGDEKKMPRMPMSEDWVAKRKSEKEKKEAAVAQALETVREYFGSGFTTQAPPAGPNSD
ncbi:hypothetical protein H2200_009435 [Cladophialophora chaetospira]|uniref:BTB domain-containing protein n=1 Tax=Cladophialophora chaetospira TaxID=386627 RepID=A0AA39CFL4_9EURO|nr:hypothetical protein H2200_009435 [Cladophialophora chaetospira]